MVAVQIDEERLGEFLGRVVVDAGAAFSAVLVYLGDKLGLYKELASSGPIGPEELAARTGTHPRMVREWLVNQAAGGYAEYDPTAERWSMTPEQATALADDESTAFVQGLFEIIVSTYRDVDKAQEAMRTGKGLGWGNHHHELFSGTERFFRPGYEANLVSSWIPALEGVADRLHAGANVADVGCGHGASTIIMAKAYPNSVFVGYDFHAPSIERARKLAAEEGVADRVTFEVGRATDLPAGGFDLIAFFDCLHDMNDPIGAVSAARRALKADGTVLLVDPHGEDTVEGNLNPVGRTFSAASTLVCTPCSLDEDGPALGALAGQARLTAVLNQGGLSRVRRAAETPFNLVLEAKP